MLTCRYCGGFGGNHRDRDGGVSDRIRCSKCHQYRCPLNFLSTGECAVCVFVAGMQSSQIQRKRNETRNAMSGRPMRYDRLAERDKLRKTRPTPSRPSDDGLPAGFVARWRGTCALCGHDFERGDRLVMWSRPKVAHRECLAGNGQDEKGCQ